MRNYQFGSATDLEVLTRLLTAERLSTYDMGNGEGIAETFRLYESNMQAAAAAMHTTGMVEVLVRNALDAALVDWWGQVAPTEDWLHSRLLDRQGTLDVNKAVSRHKPASIYPSHGQVVAELHFGFWRFLVSKRYLTTLWIPAAHRGFPFLEGKLHERRTALEAALKSLNLVRNRAAHNEPIHRRHLMEDLATAVAVASWIHPVAGAWVATRSMIPQAELVSRGTSVQSRKPIAP